MTDTKDSVIPVVCPCCGAKLWLDAETRGILKSEKAARKKSSLDDLLLKEKKRTEGMDHKLEATFELQKKKHAEAEEKFKKVLGQKDDD